LNFLKLVSLRPTRYNYARVVNFAQPTGLGPKKPPIKEAHGAKNHTKVVWVKPHPWAFFLNMKNILLNFLSSAKGR